MPVTCRALYGDLGAAFDANGQWVLGVIGPNLEHNFRVQACILRLGKKGFLTSFDFKGLRVVKISHISTSALCT